MVVMTNSSNGESLYSALLKGILGDTWNPIDWEAFTPYDKLPPRKPLVDHTAIDLGSWLSTYAGRYGTKDHLLVAETEGNHLSVTEDGKPKRDFFPETGSIFFTKDGDETLTFLFDIQTYAFRVLREAGGKDDVLPNFDWTRCVHDLCAEGRAAPASGPCGGSAYRHVVNRATPRPRSCGSLAFRQFHHQRRHQRDDVAAKLRAQFCAGRSR